jgi:colicin import membrane protein
MSKGLIISAVAHIAFLAWSIITLVARPFDKLPESAPVDIVSADEFSKMTKGTKDQKKPDPKPMVEKVAEPKPVEETAKKVTEKKEVQPTASEPPPPQAEAKPEKEKKAEKPPEPKPDPIADALKKDEAKKPDKQKAEAKPQTNPVKPQPKFDVKRIAALLDKRDPQRQAMTGTVTSPNGGVGAPTGAAETLSQSELDALRARLSQCWNPPVGAIEAQRLFVVLRVVFKPDGTVAKPPEMVEATPSPIGPAMVESATRAILQCQPFTMLRKETYSTWKDLELKFDPRDMFRG